MKPDEKEDATSVSRRNFFRGIGAAAVAGAATRATAVAEELDAANSERVRGPHAVSVSLKINGRQAAVEIEPRVTLLDVLRERMGLTGAKEVCDRATCGACTVLIDGVPQYACMTLAIEAEGREVTTIEGLAPKGQPTPLQQAFIDCDGLQCGFCTPGFVMTLSALLKKNPAPTEDEVVKACSGNLCRCGSYPHIVDAALKVAGRKREATFELIQSNDV